MKTETRLLNKINIYKKNQIFVCLAVCCDINPSY